MGESRIHATPRLRAPPYQALTAPLPRTARDPAGVPMDAHAGPLAVPMACPPELDDAEAEAAGVAEAQRGPGSPTAMAADRRGQDAAGAGAGADRAPHAHVPTAKRPRGRPPKVPRPPPPPGRPAPLTNVLGAKRPRGRPPKAVSEALRREREAAAEAKRRTLELPGEAELSPTMPDTPALGAGGERGAKPKQRQQPQPPPPPPPPPPPLTRLHTHATPKLTGTAQGVRFGSTVYSSECFGFVGSDPNRLHATVEDQTRAALNGVTAVLAAAGLPLESVVRLNVRVTDAGALETVARLCADHFPGTKEPTQTMTVVSGLLYGARVAIDAEAYAPP